MCGKFLFLLLLPLLREKQDAAGAREERKESSSSSSPSLSGAEFPPNGPGKTLVACSSPPRDICFAHAEREGRGARQSLSGRGEGLLLLQWLPGRAYSLCDDDDDDDDDTAD